MFKMALFAAMLLIAGVNRFWLTPRLASESEIAPSLKTLRQLTLHSIIEIALALMIFGVVAMLGTLHPASHFL
jgi:putative copper resistance protein D